MRKVTLKYTAFTGKRVVENARQTLQFYSGVCDVNIYQITPFLPCGLCSSYRAALYSILRKENKRHLNLFSLVVLKCCGCTKIYCLIYFHLQPCKPQRPIQAKRDIYWLGTAELIDRVCSLRGMNKEESKVKVGINYGKSFLKVSSKTMVGYYNDF